MYMFKQLNFDRQADRGGVTAPPLWCKRTCPPYTKKGTDRDGRRPFLLDAIKSSAYLLT